MKLGLVPEQFHWKDEQFHWKDELFHRKDDNVNGILVNTMTTIVLISWSKKSMT